MPNIRQLVRHITMSKEDRLLVKHGLMSDTGALTALGRRTLCDILVKDEKTKAALVSAVQAVEDAGLEVSSKNKKKK